MLLISSASCCVTHRLYHLFRCFIFVGPTVRLTFGGHLLLETLMREAERSSPTLSRNLVCAAYVVETCAVQNPLDHHYNVRERLKDANETRHAPYCRLQCKLWVSPQRASRVAAASPFALRKVSTNDA